MRAIHTPMVSDRTMATMSLTTTLPRREYLLFESFAHSRGFSKATLLRQVVQEFNQRNGRKKADVAA